MNIDRDRIHSTLLLVGCNPETLCALWLNAEDQLKKHLTNQGGGGDAQLGQSKRGVSGTGESVEASAHVAEPAVKPDSAAAASFEERVREFVHMVAVDAYGPDASHYITATEKILAARCVRAEDALAAKDAEIARLTKERDDLIEAARPNGKPAAKFMRLGERFEDAVLRLGADRDALKAALDEEVVACARWRLLAKDSRVDMDSDKAKTWERRFTEALDADASRSASRAKEGGK